jgi:pimeloyl-ACP methyl ester carboxylesterase
MGGYDQSWLLARALLADVANHRVVAISRPGYLRTPLAAGESPQEQADLCARLLDTLRIDRAMIAAVSAGGAPALQFALRHRDRCQGLVLVSAVTGRLVTHPSIQRRMRVMRAIAHIPGFAWLIRRKIRRDPNAAASRSIRDPSIRARTLADPEAAAMLQELQIGVTHDMGRRLRGTFNDTRRLAALSGIPLGDIRTPTLAIHGRDDDVVPYEHAERLANAGSVVKLTGIEGGGHLVLFTHLSAIRAAVAELYATSAN